MSLRKKHIDLGILGICKLRFEDFCFSKSWVIDKSYRNFFDEFCGIKILFCNIKSYMNNFNSDCVYFYENKNDLNVFWEEDRSRYLVKKSNRPRYWFSTGPP